MAEPCYYCGRERSCERCRPPTQLTAEQLATAVPASVPYAQPLVDLLTGKTPDGRRCVVCQAASATWYSVTKVGWEPSKCYCSEKCFALRVGRQGKEPASHQADTLSLRGPAKRWKACPDCQALGYPCSSPIDPAKHELLGTYPAEPTD